MEAEEGVELARSGRQELAVRREHVGAELDRPERRAREHVADLVQPEQERGDDAEVAAAAADRPVKVGVLVGAGAHALAAREHHLGLEQVVDGQAALARQVTEAAAEREAAHAGRRDDPAGRRKAVLVRRAVDLAPRAAAADADRARLGIDLDVLQRREVDHDPVVAGPEPGAVVPAAADGQQQAAVASEADDARDLVCVGAARDQRRPPVDHRVVDLARLVVAGVLRPDQPPAEPDELLARGLRDWHDCAHAAPFGRVEATLRRRAPARHGEP